MGPQDLAADAAIVANLRNKHERSFPVRVRARPELDDVARNESIGRESDSVPFGVCARSCEERFEHKDFVGGEHAAIVALVPDCVCAVIGLTTPSKRAESWAH